MVKKSILEKRIPSDLLLLLSAPGALALFLRPSTLVTLMLAGIFCLLVFQMLVHRKDPATRITLRPGALIMTLCFSLAGLLGFRENMGASPILGILLALWGFWAFYRLAFCLEDLLTELLPGAEKLSPWNLLIPLSAAAFFLLEPQWEPERILAWIAALGILTAAAIHLPPLQPLLREQKPGLTGYILLTALGILAFRVETLRTSGLLLAAAALPFLYVALSGFFRWLRNTLEGLGVFRGISRKEWLFYGLLFAAAALWVTCVFLKTDAFYGTEHPFDVIYTSDSPELVRENVYLDLYHSQNDLRQPLFALFAAPFMGIPGLIAAIPGIPEVVSVLVMDYIQIAILLFASFLLTRVLDLGPGKRMLFMAITFLSYPSLLFLFMMEQYVFAYFYLILTVFLISRRDPRRREAIWAAGGTLLTGMILLPGLTEHHPIREFRCWFTAMLDRCLDFLLVLLAFGRLDILLDAPSTIIMMTKFTGRSLTFADKLHQYSGFFRYTLFAPAAGDHSAAMGFASWQLEPAADFSLLGISILAVALLGLILNRKDRPSRLASWWLGFSFLVLCILGWGTQENGLILYSLYFSWAIWVLLFRLAEKLEEKIPHCTAILGGAAVLALACINLPAMAALIRFALAHYPI